MKPINFVGLLLLVCVIAFVSYRLGFGSGYVQGHHDNDHYYNGAETGHDIEQTLDMYHNAESGNMTNVMRSCRLVLRKHVSRYQTILGGSDPGDYFRDIWNEARRIANDNSLDK
jgi:hypothetical protein